jgi:predicted metal-binding membrane protein
VNSRRVFLGLVAIVFAASVAMTVASSASMSSTGTMEMPGGWAMSMMWMRTADETWLGAGISFVGMWVVMMLGMMLPSLTPALLRYHESLGSPAGAARGWLTAGVGAGYLAAWGVLGAVVFCLGSVVASVAMRQPPPARAVPMVAGGALALAGLLQQTRWKARQLARCREAPDHRLTLHTGAPAAWRHGLCLGLHCIQSCAGLTAVMLAFGVMDIRVMAVVAAAITAERLAPNGVRVARVTGAVLLGVALFLISP